MPAKGKKNAGTEKAAAGKPKPKPKKKTSRGK